MWVLLHVPNYTCCPFASYKGRRAWGRRLAVRRAALLLLLDREVLGLTAGAPQVLVDLGDDTGVLAGDVGGLREVLREIV
jgi:hypothetical protein